MHPVCAGSSGLTRLHSPALLEVAAPPLKRRKKKLLLPGSRQTGPAQARSRSPPPPRRLPAMNGGLPGFRTPTSSFVLIFYSSFSIRSGCRATAYGFDLTTIRSGSPQTMRRHRGPWSSPPRSSPSPSASAAASSTSAFPTRQVALTLL